MNQIQPIEVAIIEDQKEYSEILKTIINESPGLRCTSVYPNGEMALNEIPHMNHDIVLVDLGLPGVSGIECIKQLKAKLPKIQFMVITISEDEEKVFDALAAGANSYLLKGMMLPTIIENIKELYNGGAPMSSQIARKVVKFLRKSTTTRENPYKEMLTKREKEVLSFLSKGFSYKSIAKELFVSLETIKSHCHNIYEKLHVSNKTQALNKYYDRSDLQ